MVTEDGYAVNARQLNPSISGSLANKVELLGADLLNNYNKKSFEWGAIENADPTHVTDIRLETYKIDNRFLVISGEIDFNPTGLSQWTSTVILRDNKLRPLRAVDFVVTDEEGYSYACIFYSDGTIALILRQHIPSMHTILRMFSISIAE